MNRHLIQNVLSLTNNTKLFQILYLKKMERSEIDYLLPKIIKFKKFFKYNGKIGNYIEQNPNNISIEFFVWIHKFSYFNNIRIYNNMYSSSLFDFIAEKGNLVILKWLHENRSDGCSEHAMIFAAGFGHLDVVKYLHENRKGLNDLSESEGCIPDAMDFAAMNGHLDVVKWLHENRSDGCSEHAMNCAAGFGHLDVVKWLYENKPNINNIEKALNCAAGFGHLDVVKWLYENKPNINNIEKALNKAKQNKHLDVVNYLTNA